MKIFKAVKHAWTVVKLRKYFNLIREFYEATKGRQFSADDFRRLGFHDKLENPRYETRRVFGRMRSSGLIKQVGRIRSKHPANLGRKFALWEWTAKAKELFK